MFGKIVFFLISFLAAGATWYLYAVLRASGLHDRRMKGFNWLCGLVPFWIILTAISTVVEPDFAQAAYIFRSIPLNIIPYISCWFILNFSESKAADSRLVRYFSIGMPALALGLLFTNPRHNLYLLSYGNPPVTGPAFVAHFMVSVGYILIIYTILLRYIIKNYRRNPLLIVGGIGTVIPIIIYIIFLFIPGIVIYDLTPIGFFFTIVFVAYSSYASRLRKARPGLLSDTLAAIAKSPDISTGTIEDAARLISREGCIALDAYRIRVWDYDGETQTLKCMACYNNSIREYTVQEDFNMQNIPGFGEYLASNRILAVSNTKEAMAATGLSTPYDPEVCAVLFAPVNVDFKVVGLVCVEQNYCNSFPEQREWRMEEQNFAASLADFMAIAITNIERQNLLRQLEAELSKNIELNRIAFAHSPVGLITFADDRSIIECNDTMLSMCGVTEEYFRENFHSLSPEYQSDGLKSRDKWEDIRTRVLRGEKVITEWTHQRLDGSLIPCEILVVQVKQGDRYVGLTYVYDLSNIKQITRELEKRDTLLQAVNRAASTLLAAEVGDTFEASLRKGMEIIGCCVDADCVEIWENEAKNDSVYASLKYFWHNDLARQIKSGIAAEFSYNETPDWYSRFSQGEIIVGSIDSLSVQDRNLFSFYKAESTLIIPISIYNQFWGLCCIDNLQKPHSYSDNEIDIIRSSILMLISAVNRHNLTQRKMEEEKYRAESEAKSIFLAKMSHEIRTPMNAIIGITELLMKDLELSQKNMERVNRIYNSGELLLGIINDLLDMSKIEAGKMELDIGEYDIASMINDTVQLNLTRFFNKPVKFILYADENLPSVVLGDILRIKQILNNLLSNAAKYTMKGEVVLEARAGVGPKPNIVYLIFSVKDTGIGMTQEEIDKMFDEYTRFNNEANRMTEGTGLGMSITRNLVQLMEGQITVKSEPGKGTVFSVIIPQGKINDKVIGRETAENLQDFRMNSDPSAKRKIVIRDPMPYGSVLVVDDNDSNLYVAQSLLQLYDLKVDTAGSGFEAIEKIRNGNVYDVVFMDHMMPEMDGIETTRRLRESGYTSPIAALTANAVAGQEDVFLQNGFDVFLSKPIDIRQFDAALNKLIRDKQPLEVVLAARASVASKKSEQPYNDVLLIESVLKDVRKTITLLQDMCWNSLFENEEYLHRFTVSVHGIKSSLGNIGESVLRESAYVLEKAGRDKNTGFIKDNTPAFLDKLRELTEKLERQLTQKNAPENSPDSDPKDLHEKLLAIKEKAADYDRKGVLNLIAEIKTCSKQTRDMLNDVKENVMQSNFEEAEAIIAAYK